MRVKANQTWLLGDAHLGHENIILPGYCGRPFRDVNEMDDVILNNTNSKVGINDLLISVGDFSFQPEKYVERLTCKNIIFMKGNHDYKALKKIKIPQGRNWLILEDHILDLKFDLLVDDIEEKNYAVVCHYPMMTWNKSTYGAYHFHGHSHFKLNEFELGMAKRLDIGVDANYRRPFSKWLYDKTPTTAERKIELFGPINLVDAIAEIHKRQLIQQNQKWRDSLLLETHTEKSANI